ncbi:tigger transposable element-derived protein 1 [Trichonephila clavata]|uniref:Tigger transposable element-derived protein 1 n=1 Tax=Trichonephila clavata TaxID=2740835 RepID=A0A8X6F5Z1_TRICU|nr:tigger transposable element-derived protein 1 [Trichonephila clavata]
MERLLAIWIKDRQVKGDVTTQDIICHKAKIIYEDLKKNIPGSSSNQDNKEDFKASRGWFFRFKKRYGIHSVNMHGEAGSADKKEAEKFSINFQKFIMDEGYCPQQVFNADETGLFWKRMPSRTFITKEEKKLPGHKAMKDRLTLMISSNASETSRSNLYWFITLKIQEFLRKITLLSPNCPSIGSPIKKPG